MLVDKFAELPVDERSDRSEQVLVIRQVLDAEISDLHSRYLERRQSVLDAVDRFVSGLQQHSFNATAATAAGVIALAGAAIARRRIVARHQPLLG